MLQAFPEDRPVHTENDVTSSGESAASLFASVALGRRQVCYMVEPHALDIAAMRKATSTVAMAQRAALPAALLRAYLHGG